MNKMKHLLVVLLLLCSFCSYAQDVIVKKDGSTVVCRIVQVNSSEVVYKKWTDLNGSNYIMDRSLVSAINYESGKKDNISSVETNKYAPNNQNDGVRSTNDNALLQMDFASQHPNALQKAKNLRLLGWITGIAGIGGGVALIICGACYESGSSTNFWTYGGIGAGCIVVGGLSSILLFNKAKRYEREATRFQSYTLYRKDFNLNNGTIITPSVDILKDQLTNMHSIGVGLCYNF